MRKEALDHELARLRLGVDRPGHVDLGRAAHGEARLQPERTELGRAAREGARHSSPARVFARRHPAKSVSMRGRRRTRSRRLVLRHTAALALRLACWLCARSEWRRARGAARRPPPLFRRPGRTSGPPHCASIFVTDLAGALEPCGCTKDQLGGIDHFGAWVRQSAVATPNGLVASAGPLFFMDPALGTERADQDRAKARDDRAGAPFPGPGGVRARRERLGRRQRGPGQAGGRRGRAGDRPCAPAGFAVAAVRLGDRSRRGRA